MLHCYSSMKRALPYVIIGALFLFAAGVFLTRDDWFPGYAGLTRNQPRPATLFAVIGDTEGHNDILKSAIAEAKSRGASFLLHVGDITEDGSTEQFDLFRQTLTDSGLPWLVAVGNHDIRGDDTRRRFSDAFNQPNMAVDLGDYRLVVLDNAERKVGFSDETLAWLENELTAHPKARYILAFHRPFNLPLSAIFGDDETPASRSTNQVFLNLIDRVRVETIFTGHLHVYLPYSLDGIRTFVTGGGGGEAQAALGPLGQQSKHFLMVRADPQGVNVDVIKLE